MDALDAFNVAERLIRPRALLASVAFVLALSGCEKHAQTPPASTSGPQPEIAQSRVMWRQAMARLAVPAKGCFKASFPRIEWQSSACKTPPQRPYTPKRGPHHDTVGNNTDFSAEVGSSISWTTGSFDSVSGVTSETGTVFGDNCSNPVSNVVNTFSLQLNTKPFATSLCNGAQNSGCQGWQQFVYSNTGFAFIQYWLLNYGANCPSGWKPFSPADCWMNGPNSADVPAQDITDLGSLSLSGFVTTTADTVYMTTAAGDVYVAQEDSVLILSGAWKGAEFVVVGDGCASQANFNAGSTIVVRTAVLDGASAAPSCVEEGFTGETNNLNLVGTSSVRGGSWPAVVSTQSNVADTPASCTACDVCQPTTCAAQGAKCGSVPDGCCGTLYCGSCQSGYVCHEGTCVDNNPCDDCKNPVPYCCNGGCSRYPCSGRSDAPVASTAKKKKTFKDQLPGKGP